MSCSDILMVTATGLMALFTGLLWYQTRQTRHDSHQRWIYERHKEKEIEFTEICILANKAKNEICNLINDIDYCDQNDTAMRTQSDITFMEHCFDIEGGYPESILYNYLIDTDMGNRISLDDIVAFRTALFDIKQDPCPPSDYEALQHVLPVLDELILLKHTQANVERNAANELLKNNIK